MNEWRFFVQMLGTNLGKCEWGWEENLRWQNSICLPSSSWVRMNEWSFFCAKWLNSRWLPSSSWVRMNDYESDWMSWSQSFEHNGWIQDGRTQDGRIQDGCHHQVKWEWMSLIQIELIWVRIRVEGEGFWVNLREDNKVSKCKMTESESNMAEFKMAAIIKLSQNEWVKFFLYKMAESRMAEFKIAAIIKLSQNEWVRFCWELILASVSEFERKN